MVAAINLKSNFCIFLKIGHCLYFNLQDEINAQRRKPGMGVSLSINPKAYRAIFNDFDINNQKIKKFLNEVDRLSIFRNFIVTNSNISLPSIFLYNRKT